MTSSEKPRQFCMISQLNLIARGLSINNQKLVDLFFQPLTRKREIRVDAFLKSLSIYKKKKEEEKKDSKFEPNAQRGSRVMSIFNKRSRPAKMMLGEASSPFLHTRGWTMLKYISIQNLNQIYHAVQEL